MENIINKITCADCIDFMRQYIQDNSVDMVLTSPPYDNLRNYKDRNKIIINKDINTNTETNTNETISPFTFENFKIVAQQLYRIMKEGSVMVWIVGDATIKGSETGTSFKQALYFKEIGFKIHDTMIYEKNGVAYPDSNRYYQKFEYMFIFVKGKKIKTYNLLSDRKNNCEGSWSAISHRNKDGELIKSNKKIKCKEYGVRFNIWKYNTGANFSTNDKLAFNHPAIFPEKLAGDHILSWSNENDIVFDPFMGSGTTAKMCLKYNRKFIGCDISQEYCGLASERIDNFIKLQDELKEKEKIKQIKLEKDQAIKQIQFDLFNEYLTNG